MKLSVSTTFLCLWPACLAASNYRVVPNYAEKTKATVSSNVNWSSQDGSKVVDGVFSNDSPGVYYTSDTCDVSAKDLGYVTIDLGSSQFIDGVRVYMHSGVAGQEYCNVFMNVYDDAEEITDEPLDVAITSFPVSTVPTAFPTESTVAPTTAPPTSKAPTASPTVSTAAPTSRVRGATTASPTESPTPQEDDKDDAKHQDDDNVDTKEGQMCAVCNSDFCEKDNHQTQCPLDKPYCVTKLTNHDNGSREVKKLCGSIRMCHDEWFEESSDVKMCTEFSDGFRYAYTNFKCTYCCVTDDCNMGDIIRPAPETYYNAANYRGGRHLTKKKKHESNIYSSGTDHEYLTKIESSGLDIPILPGRFVRYIRFWAGRNSVDNEVRVLEIQPLYEKMQDELPTGGAGVPVGVSGDDGSVTDVETGSVTVSLTGSSSGDPHFKTWSGDKYDFHGGCSLVLLQNIGFANELGLNIHIRTKISTWWSSIETAAVQIGPDTLEVTGGENGGKHWLNKESFEEIRDGAFFTLAGFHVQFHQVTSKQKKYRIELGNGDAMSIETYKDFVRVNVKAQNKEQFHGSLGLMGEYPSGLKVGRDGSTVVEDPNAFGREWQVLASEPMLFHSVEGPQHPLECAMPDPTESATKRRLGESLISEEEASAACAKVDEDDFDHCVFDVVATNDMDMAGSY